MQIHNRETAGHPRQRADLNSSQGERQARQGGERIQSVADLSAAERRLDARSVLSTLLEGNRGPPRTVPDLPGDSDGKESACNAGDLGSIPELGRSTGKRNGNPLQYSCLRNPMDRGAWWATVHGVANNQT